MQPGCGSVAGHSPRCETCRNHARSPCRPNAGERIHAWMDSRPFARAQSGLDLSVSEASSEGLAAGNDPVLVAELLRDRCE